MKILNQFINQYELSIIHSIFLALVSYISLTIKRVYHRYTEDKIKKEVVRMVCKAINQLYPNDCGEIKLNYAINNTREILKEKGINISDLELRMYIEATVNDFVASKKEDI